MSEEKSQEEEESQQIKLRPDLELMPFPDGTLQIRDPQAVRFFHLGFDEAEIIRMLGHIHPIEIIKRTSYTEKDLKQFLGMLKQWGLLEGTSAPPIQSTKSKTILQFLFQRFRLIEPDDLLDEWEPRLRWLWSNPMKAIGIAIFVLATICFAQNAPHFVKYGWPLIAESWIITLIVFVFMLFTVLSGHEMAHGIALKSFGGNVPEMGFYFVYATPSLYTDVSDIYRLPKTSQKIWVMMAGPVFQTSIGCLAFLLWNSAVPHTAVADLLFLLVTASFFSLSVNLNPLIRLDGYYALQLALGVHALRRRAWAYIRSIVMNEDPPEKLSTRERKIFLLYAPLSVIYTSSIMMVVMSFYFSKSFLDFPAITLLAIVGLFLASLTPLPPQKGLEEMDTAPTMPAKA